MPLLGAGGAIVEKRLLVFGIDGATWDVINPLMARGEMPNLQAVVEAGVHGPLRSTLPPISPPAWGSLVTGQSPGRHGVFDFWARDLTQYADTTYRLNQSTAFAGRTLWDHLGAAGFRVGAVSVPVTYPAWPVNGFLISGMLLAPGMNDLAAYPPELARRYGVSLNFPDAYRRGASLEEVMREGPAMMRRRRRVVLELLAEMPCDFLMVVFGETDKAQHDFWRFIEGDATEDERKRYGDAIAAHYRLADEILGDIWRAFGQDALVAVVSDHGAGPYPRRAFRTNAWLAEQGLLAARSAGPARHGRVAGLVRQAKRWLPRRLQRGFRRHGGVLVRVLYRRYSGLNEIEWQRTVAYRVPMQAPSEGIVINLQGRQPEGIVPPQEYVPMVERIARLATEARDAETGEPVVEEVLRRDEVYQGPYTERYAPDLILMLRPSYKGEWGNVSPFVVPVPAAERELYSGTHTMEGVFALCGPGIRRGARVEGASVMDVMPTLLHALGLPVPTSVDGRVLLDVFADPLAHPVRTSDDSATATVTAKAALSAQDEQEVVERLRGLGYLD